LGLLTREDTGRSACATKQKRPGDAGAEFYTEILYHEGLDKYQQKTSRLSPSSPRIANCLFLVALRWRKLRPPVVEFGKDVLTFLVYFGPPNYIQPLQSDVACSAYAE